MDVYIYKYMLYIYIYIDIYIYRTPSKSSSGSTISVTLRRDDVIFYRFVNTNAREHERVVIIFLRIVPKLLQFRKYTSVIVTSEFRERCTSFLCVSTIQIAVHISTRQRFSARCSRNEATCDRIKRANYDRHDLNRRFI